MLDLQCRQFVSYLAHLIQIVRGLAFAHFVGDAIRFERTKHGGQIDIRRQVTRIVLVADVVARHLLKDVRVYPKGRAQEPPPAFRETVPDPECPDRVIRRRQPGDRKRQGIEPLFIAQRGDFGALGPDHLYQVAILYGCIRRPLSLEKGEDRLDPSPEHVCGRMLVHSVGDQRCRPRFFALGGAKDDLAVPGERLKVACQGFVRGIVAQRRETRIVHSLLFGVRHAGQVKQRRDGNAVAGGNQRQFSVHDGRDHLRYLKGGIDQRQGHGKVCRIAQCSGCDALFGRCGRYLHGLVLGPGEIVHLTIQHPEFGQLVALFHGNIDLAQELTGRIQYKVGRDKGRNLRVLGVAVQRAKALIGPGDDHKAALCQGTGLRHAECVAERRGGRDALCRQGQTVTIVESG